MLQVQLPKKFHSQKNKLAKFPLGGDALFIVNLFKQNNFPLLYIVNDGYQLQRLQNELNLFAPELRIGVFNDYEVLPYERQSPYSELIASRLRTLWQVQHQQVDILLLQATTLQMLLPPPSYLSQRLLLLKRGDCLNISHLKEQLVRTGYQYVNQVCAAGEFAIRGSIIDILPMGSKVAIRIELFDNEIETLNYFDSKTQLIIETVETIELLPSREYPHDAASLENLVTNFIKHFPNQAKSNLAKDMQSQLLPAGIEFYLPLFFDKCSTIFDYLSPNWQIIYDIDLQSHLQLNWQEINKRFEYYNYQYPCLKPSELFLAQEDVFAGIKAFTCWEIANEGELYTGFDYLPAIAVDKEQQNPFARLLLLAKKQNLVICAASLGRLEILRETLATHQLNFTILKDLENEKLLETRLALIQAPLQQGFSYGNTLFITEADLYPYAKTLRRAPRQNAKNTANNDLIVRDLAEVKVGDYVVHLNHGIGKYIGLTMQEIADTVYEMIEIEYQNNAKLFIPVQNLHLISRYSHIEGTHTELTKLGSKHWDKIKNKTEQRVNDLAAELLELYARREMQEGHIIPLPNEYNDFAASFGYEPTIDQQNSFDEIIRDLGQKKPMDRLVCGDVGFGKTEVAMRAAFIAAINGYQVAILAPTTLLTEQLYQNLVNRFAGFPINIGEVSRFKSRKEISETLSLLANGRLDIIVGTHRLIQDDVKFSKLGLVIIDEEHRFGVKQKEKFKQFRSNVDILTMTATPIPRTLSMALDGLRDFSIIATAPSRRLSVNTLVTSDDNAILSEAILREVRRGGQVFFLYNDVASIESMYQRLAKLLPELRIAIAHGQMPEQELEQTIKDFINQRYNLLLCSTIIETGIDIPNANTIIIYRADKFGLAQLHQLRGRVGRSHHQAYCYLLIPEKITGDAQKRLDAIQATSELGAGFNLAMHDLEIRGAGEVLGDNQAGNIKEVGLSLYTEMLKKAIKKLKNGEKLHGSLEVDTYCEVNLNATTILPNDYCSSVHERLIYYKRFAKADNSEQLDLIYQEIIDNFGLPPIAVKNLLLMHEIRLIATKLGIQKLDATINSITLAFIDKPPIEPLRIILLLQKLKTCKYDGKSKLIWSIKSETTEDKVKHIHLILNELNG